MVKNCRNGTYGNGRNGTNRAKYHIWVKLFEKGKLKFVEDGL